MWLIFAGICKKAIKIRFWHLNLKDFKWIEPMEFFAVE